MKVRPLTEHAQNDVVLDGATGVRMRMLIGRGDGARRFHMRHFEVQPGGHTPLHTHPQEHEVFIVEGRGTFVYEGQEHEFDAEHVIFVPPNKEHRFMNTGDSLLRMLCIIPTRSV